jgi:hypothetical protein
MSDSDATVDHEHEHRSLGHALADLAATMPEDPYRVEGVHARARRLRQRRRATRVTAGVVVSAATIAALVAVRPGPTHVSTVPASQPTTTSALPSCSAALAAAPTRAVVPAREPNVSIAADPAKEAGSDAADAAKQAAADAADTAKQGATGLQGVKGLGTIVSATDTSVTITLEGPLAGEPSEITATISPTAEFADGTNTVAALPSLTAGDRVAFAVTQADDGSYQLIYLEVHLPEQPTPTSETVDPAEKAARAARAAADEHYLKAMAEVVSVQPDSLTLKITDGDPADQVLTAATGPDSVYMAGDQKCVDPQLSAGQTVGVLLVHADDGAYLVQDVVLFQPPATATPAP